MTKDEFDVARILKEYGAKSEEDLTNILENEWNLVPCAICGKQIDITHCDYDDDDPVCLGGCH